MRTCLRCGNTMKENCAIRIESGGNGIVIALDEKRLFSERIGQPRVSVCPECGEISIYVKNTEKVK